MQTTNQTYADPSGEVLPEKNYVPGNRGQTESYEPQALIAARYILADKPPSPEEVFLELFHGFTLDFEGFATSARTPKPRDPELVSPDLPLPQLKRFLDAPETPRLKRSMIAEALREVFDVLKSVTARPGEGERLKIGNLNLYNRLLRACVEEMEALVSDWDDLNRESAL